MQKTLYIMIPNDIPKDMIFDMLEMRFDITLFSDVETGRAAVVEADNDPDDGYVVGVTFDIRDENGDIINEEDDAPQGIAVGEPHPKGPKGAPKTGPIPTPEKE